MALGVQAGSGNTTGFSNTFIGYKAHPNAANLSNATALGVGALVTASNTVVLGNNNITAIRANVQSITALFGPAAEKGHYGLGSGSRPRPHW